VTLAGWVIWAAFLAEFAISFLVAPRKLRFLQENWIAALSLLLPALRVFRAFRAIRAFRAARTFRVVALTNRNLRKLGILFARRKFAYLLGSAAVVVFASAAGVYLVEREAPAANIRSYADAVWWASGTVTTAGTELYPVTGEGRFLAFLTMLFGVSAFGYVAGSLATHFLHVDAMEAQAEERAEAATPEEQRQKLQELEARVSALRASLRPPNAPSSHGREAAD
jgi:voltage-gated potassium channel